VTAGAPFRLACPPCTPIFEIRHAAKACARGSLDFGDKISIAGLANSYCACAIVTCRFPKESVLTLLVQLAVTALLSVLMTLLHGAGVVAIARALRLDGERPGRRGFHFGTVPVLSAVALLLFALHSLEIALFAGFYLAVGAFAGLEEALFFSTTAYATLSQPAAGFPVEWRLVGAMEGLIGFILIGWSTAFFVTDMNRLLRE